MIGGCFCSGVINFAVELLIITSFCVVGWVCGLGKEVIWCLRVIVSNYWLFGGWSQVCGVNL